MMYDLSPGDVIRIGEAVTLTVLAIEGGLIRLGLEAPGGERPANVECPQAGPSQGWWEHN